MSRTCRQKTLLATCPRRVRWCRRRGGYTERVQQVETVRVLHKPCKTCRTWKVTHPNFDRHEYDGFRYIGDGITSTVTDAMR
eukprot:scaffold426_cov219-Amphora_coffeaeformis.AAC.66